MVVDLDFICKNIYVTLGGSYVFIIQTQGTVGEVQSVTKLLLFHHKTLKTHWKEVIHIERYIQQFLAIQMPLILACTQEVIA
jgi:hypothetical protein